MPAPKRWVSATCGALLAPLLAMSPAHAGDDMSDKSPSAISTLVVSASAVMILSAPLFLSMEAVAAGTRKRRRDEPRPRAQPLPDMAVTSIEAKPDGGRSVRLEVPGAPDKHTVLAWPQRQDNPAEGFQLGQTVSFIPSAEGAGWMLRDTAGTALAFVPSAQAAGDSHSQAM